jgi:serine/threonine-protein kinase
MVDARIGAYRLGREIGRDMLGTDHEAFVDEPVAGLPVGTRVAFRLLPPFFVERPSFLDAFFEEAGRVSGIDDPHVVRLLDWGQGEREGRPHAFLAMEPAEGASLVELGSQGQPVPEGLCRRVGRGAARALAALHAAGVVHGSLEPRHLVIRPDRNVRLRRLGLALRAAESIEGAHGFRGSTVYLAPEQLMGSDIDARTDLYALGLLLYELVTTCRPFSQDTVGEMVHARMLGRFVPLRSVDEEISSDFEHVVHTLIARQPGDRFASAEELVAALGKDDGSAP